MPEKMINEISAKRVEFNDEHLTHALMMCMMYIDDEVISQSMITEMNSFFDFNKQLWFINLFIDEPDFEDCVVKGDVIKESAGSEEIDNDDECPFEPTSTVTDLETQIHLNHCYQSNYPMSCKYGDENCPAKPIYYASRTDEELEEMIKDVPADRKAEALAILKGLRENAKDSEQSLTDNLSSV
jgi:hypothetical protein